MKTLEGWKTLPEAAKEWGVTRAWVWRLVSEGRIPEGVLTKAGDRWMLDPAFVQAVLSRLPKKGRGQGDVIEAIDEVADGS